MTDPAQAAAVAAAEALLNDATLQALPELCIDGLPPQHQVKLVLDALERHNDPPSLFSYGSGIARLADREDATSIKELGWLGLRAEVVARLTLVRVTPSLERKPYWPPRQLVETIHNQPGFTFPRLQRVVSTPVFSPNGELVQTPGYHADSGVYYRPAKGFALPRPVPNAPSKADVDKAVSLWLDELLVDFAFVGDADRANALSIGLERFARSLVVGPTPLRLFSKPTHGSGATLLANVLLTPGLGYTPASSSEKRNEDDFRKWLSSIIFEGQPLAYIGNLHRRLESPALSEAITQTRWTDRVLGATRTFEAPVHQTFLATANNPMLTAEVARRAVLIRLDPKTERPWELTGWRHDPLELWAREQCGELAYAALVIIQAWLAAGRPMPADLPVMGSFESWARIHGGILAYCGVPGFLTNREQLFEAADTQTNVYRAFLGDWWDTFQDNFKLAAELVPVAVKSDLLDEKVASAQSLGNLLGELVDRTINLDQDDQHAERPLSVVVHRTRVRGRNQWHLTAAVATTAFSGTRGTTGTPPENETVQNGVAPTTPGGAPQEGGGTTSKAPPSEFASAPEVPEAPKNGVAGLLLCRTCGQVLSDADIRAGNTFHNRCDPPW